MGTTNEALAEKPAAKAPDEAMHFCPADDSYTRTCRTVCGKIRPVAQVYSPRVFASTLRLIEQGVVLSGRSIVCPKCIDRMVQFRLHSSKPITIRRLRTFLKEQRMPEQTVASARQTALAAALVARRAETDDPDDPIYQLLGELMMLEVAVIDGQRRAQHDTMLSSWSLMLIKLKPSPAVMRALHGR